MIGRALFAALALGCLSAAGFAQPAPPAPPAAPAANSAKQSPAVKKVVELARSSGLKAMVYYECDNRTLGAPTQVMIRIVGQRPGKTELLYLTEGPDVTDIFNALAAETSESGGARIVIVVDGPTVDVRREPWQGPFAAATARANVEADRVFPGHS